MNCHSVFNCVGHKHELSDNRLIKETVLKYVNEAEFKELFTIAALEKVETVTSSAIAATSSAIKASLDARKAVNDLTAQTIDFVNDAINNTAVEGGVLADTFVTVTKKTATAVARSMRDVNSDTVSVLDFYDPVVHGSVHNTAFKLAVAYLDTKGGGTLQIPDGIFYLDPSEPSILLKDNIELRGGQNTVIELTEFNESGAWGVFTLSDTNNVVIRNIKFRGRKDLRKPNVIGVPDGIYYKDFRANPVVKVGEYVYGHGAGFIVEKAGTCELWDYATGRIPFVNKHKLENLTTTPVYLQTGTAKLRYVERDIGESIMGLSLYSAKNTILDNLDFDGFWGDGLYISRGGNFWYPSRYSAYSENLVASNIKISNCRRQGISIISLKNARFNNIEISNIFGTAPEAFIDFEPDHVDNILEDIEFNNLKTSGVMSAGVTFNLNAFTSAYASFNRDAYDLDGHDQTKPIEQINYFIAKSVEASQNPKKISVTINNWTGSSGQGFSLYGYRNSTEMGYIEINNSSILYDYASKSLGCVLLRGTQKDAPTIKINKTDLISDFYGAQAHITLDKPSRISPILGGVHLHDVTTITRKPIRLGAPADIILSDSSELTDRFEDISIIDCNAEPKVNGRAIAYLGTFHTDKRPTGVRIVDHKENFAFDMPDNAENYTLMNSGFVPTVFYRPDSDALIYELAINNFPNGGGSIVKVSNELCSAGSNKTLEVTVPHYSNFVNLEKNSNTVSSTGGGKQRLVIPAGSYVTIRTIDANNGYIEHMDAATYRATLNYGGKLVVPLEDPLEVGVGAMVKRIIHMPNLLKDSLVLANTSTVNLKGLTLTTKVGSSAYVTLEFKNNTNAVIKWAGVLEVLVV